MYFGFIVIQLFLHEFCWISIFCLKMSSNLVFFFTFCLNILLSCALQLFLHLDAYWNGKKIASCLLTNCKWKSWCVQLLRLPSSLENTPVYNKLLVCLNACSTLFIKCVYHLNVVLLYIFYVVWPNIFSFLSYAVFDNAFSSPLIIMPFTHITHIYRLYTST